MKSFKVSNFRLFGEEGAELNLKPVTVITGPNSSGKSSYVNSMRLFSGYLQKLLNDYRRDGGFNPFETPLVFSEQGLGGFDSTFPRDSAKDGFMSFSMEVKPSVSSLHSYSVTYSFKASSDLLGNGTITGISIKSNGKDIMRISLKDKGESLVDYFNNNEVLVDFITFFRYVYFPYRIYESSHDPYGGFDDTLCDENGEFSVEKASKSEIGRRLAKIQGLDVPTFDYVGLVRNLPSGASEEYKALLATDLLDAMEKMFEHNLVFYFPVLDRFIGKNREESIAILREHVDFSKSIGAITSQTKHLRESIETIVQDYQQSEFDSFIDYFRSLENYVLEHPNNPIHFGRWGKSFNLIEDSIIRKVEVSYDSLGFSQRKEKETLFSTVYNVLSSWQWAVGESNDWQWMHDNAGGDAISELWHKSDNFIVRDIDWESSYFSSKHRLFEAYKDFLKIVLHECLLSTDLSYIYHISPFTPVKKLYSFEDEDVSDFVKIINKYLNNRSYLLKAEDDYRYLPGKDNNNKYIPDTFLNKWLGEDGFNICQSLIFEVPLGLGFSLRLNQGGYDEFLSDVGHGITQIVSILLSIESVLIENEVLELKRAKKQETISAPKSIITIEEPEVSLHPRFQSMLADMLYDASMKYGDHVVFLVETHSEYLVRRMQAIVSNFTNDEFNDNPFVVYYFEPNGNVYDLKFKKAGRFENSFGPGFLDESAKLKYILRANAAKNLNED